MKGRTEWLGLISVILLLNCHSIRADKPVPELSANQAVAIGTSCPSWQVCPAGTVRCECNQAGSIIYEEYDWENDGIIDQQSMYDFDELQRMTRETVNNFDAGPYAYERTIVTYDSSTTPMLGTYEVDSDRDGYFDQVMHFYYDGSGGLSSIEDDLDYDGLIDVRYECTPPCPIPYEDSCLTACAVIETPSAWAAGETYDACTDPTVCSPGATYCQCDESLRPVYEEIDESGDGVVDVCNSYAYGPQGLLTSHYAESDTNGDMVVDTWVTHTYGEMNFVMEGRIEEDKTGDGIPDSIITWINDPDGRVMRIVLDNNNDFVPEAVYYCNPPCAGTLVECIASCQAGI